MLLSSFQHGFKYAPSVKKAAHASIVSPFLLFARQIFQTVLVALCVFFLSMNILGQYVVQPDASELNPQIILESKSSPPFQYRILPALIFAALKPAISDPDLADGVMQSLSIMLFVAVAFYFLYRHTGSLFVSFIGLLALKGCLFDTHWLKMRNEFFEAAFVMLLFLELERQSIRWGNIFVLTVIAALNRETWIIVLFAFTAEVWLRSSGPWLGNARLRILLKSAACVMGYILVQVCIRTYFGQRPYYGSIDVTLNLMNLQIKDHHPFWGVGSGLYGFLFLSVLSGNRVLLRPFCLYFFALFATAFLFAAIGEGRIFLPTFPIAIASLLRWLLTKRPGPSGWCSTGRAH